MLLSICIPTFKRTSELKRALNSIDTKQKELIEILIIENHSDKCAEVKEIIENYCEKTQYDIRTIFNEDNIGYDRNINKLISNANGDFCIFLSDDDMFMPGKLDAAIDLIKNNTELNGFIFGFEYCNLYKNKSRIIKYVDFFTKVSRGNIKCIYDATSLISGLCLKRKSALNYISNQAFLGSLFNQVFIFCSITDESDVGISDIILTKYINDGENTFGYSNDEPKMLNNKNLYTMIDRNVSNLQIAKYFDDKDGSNLYKNSTNKLLRAEMINLIEARRTSFKELIKYSFYTISHYKRITLVYCLELIFVMIFGYNLSLKFYRCVKKY